MVTITIDDKSLQVPAGMSVLQAAQQNDIYIPTLCHHPQLTPIGACRLCLVEIEGVRGLNPACTTTVAEGMIVRTSTPVVQEMRRDVLSLILSEHPYTCLVCDRHDRCDDWQGTIRKAGVTTGCQNCPNNGQCEIQELVEKVGLSAMPYPITYRGFEVEKEDPFFDRDYNLCVMCRRCVRVCQDVRHNSVLGINFRGAEARIGTAFNQSHKELDCEFCGACVDVCPSGALFDKRTRWEGVPDKTATIVCPYCSVGCQLDLQIKNERVIGVRPTLDGSVNQGQACTRGRFGLTDIIHATDRLRFPLVRQSIQEGQVTHDGNQNTRLVATNWDEALRTAAEKLAVYKGDAFAMITSPYLTNESLYVLKNFARDVMQSNNVACGTGLNQAAVSALAQTTSRAEIKNIRASRSIVLIGGNPRESHPVVALQIRQAQAQGARLIVLDPRETDLAKRADVWLRVKPGEDREWLSELAKQVKRKRPAKATTKQMAEIAAAAQLLRENSPATIIYGSGVMQYPDAARTIRAIQQLADALKPAAVLLPLLGAANTMGALNMNADTPDKKRSYAEIVARIAAGEIKALYLVGEVPPLPVLDRLEVLIVQDILPSPNWEAHADVVLPATTFAEMAGSLTNLEGRTQKFDAAIAPLGEARPDWWIATELAHCVNAVRFGYQSSADVFAEIERQPQPIIATDKKAKAAPVLAETTSSKYPFLLVIERNQFAYRSGLLTERIKGMDQIRREDLVIIHPTDAKRLGVQDGDPVRLVSAHGSQTGQARVSAAVLPKMIFATINPLAGSDLFPARLPETKTCAIRLEKIEGKA